MSASGGPVETVSTVVVPNPAAGADWSYAVTALGMLVAFTAELVTSATVATRTVAINLKDSGGNLIAAAVAPANQAAGQGVIYQGQTSGQAQAVGAVDIVLFPTGLVLPIGAIISSSTAAIQAGDQWSAIVLTFGPV